MRAATFVALVVAVTLLSGCSEETPAASDPTPAARTATQSQETGLPSDGGAYIALGDSLSAGVGASSPETTFVALVRTHLGPDVELINLGHSGDTSDDLLQAGKLDEALTAITTRAEDADPSNDVRLVTLEIGGNDLLGIYFSQVQTGVCPDVETALSKPECTETLRNALDTFRPNFETMLQGLEESAPGVPLIVMTLYNPFDFLGELGELGVLSLDGLAGTAFPEGLNDIIREVAAEHGVPVADVYSAFKGRTASLLFSDFIHPNDAGYRVMADAFIDQIESR
jgi:lysophospholipase L1-like esterase